MDLFDTPEIFRQFPELLAVQSKRTGGLSKAPFSSLNLGLSTNDPAVDANRKLFFEAVGISEDQIASAHQVHGNKVYVAETPGRQSGYDAVITNKPGIIAGVTIADCTPVLIYDKANHAVAAIHAGWRGAVGKIVTEALSAMQVNYGTRGENCYACIGTCISFAAFEVGEEVAKEFDEEFVRFDKEKQKYFVDLKAANRKQLTDFGIPVSQIEISEKCTVLNNNEYFSYRKEKGQTGRMLALIGLR